MILRPKCIVTSRAKTYAATFTCWLETSLPLDPKKRFWTSKGKGAWENWRMWTRSEEDMDEDVEKRRRRMRRIRRRGGGGGGE